MEISDIWCEKYRPASLNDVVLNKNTLTYFKSVQQEKSVPNLLFVGQPGIGKTTLAKVIVNDILKC
tara:strand:+ start:473 stop:670 length:198 start_codon:yes stop_codon:yes gene_type:complete